MSAPLKLAPMPRANEFVSPDGALTPAALNYLGNLEKITKILAGASGSNSSFLATAGAADAVAPASVSAVTLAASRAGASWTLIELGVAMDEIKGTTLPAINTQFTSLQTTMNQILAALQAANLMEP